jgi:hypothetical protein
MRGREGEGMSEKERKRKMEAGDTQPFPGGRIRNKTD